MEKKYIKINDPDHEFNGSTFLLFFEGVDTYYLRGYGTQLVILKDKGIAGEEKDYVKARPNDTLENFLNTAPPPIEEEVNIIPQKIVIDKTLLDALDKMQARIAMKHSVVLPRKTIAGIAAAYFEEMTTCVPSKDPAVNMMMKAFAADARQLEEDL